jgi:nucleotide-binding universal stress UspA family protein
MAGKQDRAHELTLEHAATGLRGAGFTVTADLVAGDPDEVVAREVTQRNIDIVVMGAYGHSRVRNLILGSTTTHLIRTCHVPIVLFR